MTEPKHLNLEQQRKRAKELLKLYRAGDHQAARRIQEQLPRRFDRGEADARTLGLAQTQAVIAREAGYSSWPKLRQALEERDDRLNALIKAAVAGDEQRVERILTQHPDLATNSVHAACALGDETAVKAQALEKQTPGGPKNWTPLTYLCASRYGRGDLQKAQARKRLAEILLTKGADARDKFNSMEDMDGDCLVLTAAARCVGHVDLLRVLLEAGAERKHGPALWAAARYPGVDGDPLACLRLLLADKPPWWQLKIALSTCVDTENLAGVELLLEEGAEANSSGGWGRGGSLVHRAIIQESKPEILRSLAEKADLEKRDGDGRSALCLARILGLRGAEKILLSAGAKDEALSELDAQVAGAMRGESIPQSSNQQGIDRGLQDLLAWAISKGREQAIPGLLAFGLNPNLPDRDGRSALSQAEALGQDECAWVLRAAGARAFSREDEVCKEDEEIESFEGAADAIVNGELDLLRRLLDEDPELIKRRSPRPHHAQLIHYVGANGVEAYRQKTPANAVAILKLLIERGADANSLCGTYGGGPAQTTLALLVSSGWPAEAGLQGKLVRGLCAAGADPNGIDDDGLPMASAVGFRQTQALEALIACGARLDNLLYAAAAGRVDLVEQDVDEKGRLRSTAKGLLIPWLQLSRDPVEAPGQAMVIAGRFGHVEVLRCLVARGVDPGAHGSDGISALHEAAFMGHEDCVRYLLEQGVDPKQRDGLYDADAIGWAAEAKNRGMIELIQGYS